MVSLERIFRNGTHSRFTTVYTDNDIGIGSVAKNHDIEAKIWFHIKEYKKAEYFSDNI
jgi:hypothetical protein